MAKTEGWDFPFDSSLDRWEGMLRIRDIKTHASVFVEAFQSGDKVHHLHPGFGLVDIEDVEDRNRKIHATSYRGPIQHLPALLADLRKLGGSIQTYDVFVNLLDRHGYRKLAFHPYSYPLPLDVPEPSDFSVGWQKRCGVVFKYFDQLSLQGGALHEGEWIKSDEYISVMDYDRNTGEWFPVEQLFSPIQ